MEAENSKLAGQIIPSGAAHVLGNVNTDSK
jgi:hypothetical protein